MSCKCYKKVEGNEDNSVLPKAHGGKNEQKNSQTIWLERVMMAIQLDFLHKLFIEFIPEARIDVILDKFN